MSGDGNEKEPEGARYGADDGPIPLWSPGVPLPVYAVIEGRSVALVDGGEYRTLIAMREAVIRGNTATPTTGAGKVKAGPADNQVDRAGYTTIDRDPEVATFLRERFPRRETIATIHAACIERFGPERTPSTTRISTFRTRWRRR